MGQLAGFRYRDIVRRLKAVGLEFHRQAAGSREIWFNPALNRYEVSTFTQLFTTTLLT